MILTTLKLKNFRNYLEGEFSFSPSTNLVLGANASGKTNLLEAIFLLAQGKSFKAETNYQLISWGKLASLIEGELKEKNQSLTLTVRLVTQPGEKKVKKLFLVNGVNKTRTQFLSFFHLVLFRPEDIRIVTGSPTRRREFLDLSLTSFDWRYSKTLSLYRRALKQRNQLLDKIRQGKANKKELFFWDQTLIKNGQLIFNARQELIEKFNQFLKTNPEKEIRRLSLRYQPNFLSEKKLIANFSRDLQQGFTSCGPHKDDFIIEDQQFASSEKNIAFWGSRAQQRLAILALRLAQINLIREKTGQQPLLLLDDIFSELDQNHQQLLTRIINRGQVIVTATSLPPASFFSPQKIITLKKAGNGRGSD